MNDLGKTTKDSESSIFIRDILKLCKAQYKGQKVVANLDDY